MTSPLPASLAVRVSGLGKRYRIGLASTDEMTLAGGLWRAFGAPLRNLRQLRRLRSFGLEEEGPDIIWALRDASFELAPGEVLGVIGRNGAGKSTLLKILSRITEPSAGRAELRGRVASLLEVGTGFHADLTGRDNVFLNGTILGMTRREVTSRFDEIVDFAEIEKFIDTPVKHYSSGMYVRLAFAVAAHLEPDVLIADEVLAVGDAEFQRKCLGKMRAVAGSGRTVIFVSHNKAAVADLCTRAIWLDAGRIRDEGGVDEVLSAYVHSIESRELTLADRTDRTGNGRVRVRQVVFRSASGAPVRVLRAGEDAEIALLYESEAGEGLRTVVATIQIDSILGHRIATVSNAYSGDELAALPSRGEIVCRLPRLPLNEGEYVCSFKVKVNGVHADWVPDAAAFSVDAVNFYSSRRHPAAASGALLLDSEWEVGPGVLHAATASHLE